MCDKQPNSSNRNSSNSHNNNNISLLHNGLPPAPSPSQQQPICTTTTSNSSSTCPSSGKTMSMVSSNKSTTQTNELVQLFHTHRTGSDTWSCPIPIDVYTSPNPNIPECPTYDAAQPICQPISMDFTSTMGSSPLRHATKHDYTNEAFYLPPSLIHFIIQTWTPTSEMPVPLLLLKWLPMASEVLRVLPMSTI